MEGSAIGAARRGAPLEPPVEALARVRATGRVAAARLRHYVPAMGHASLRAAVDDLARVGMLRSIDVEVDPRLEMGEIQRRVYANGGPALLFTRPKGSAFPMLGNLFGSIERARFLFRDAFEGVRALVDAKVDPRDLLRNPGRALRLPAAAAFLLPRTVRTGPVLERTTSLSSLPQLVSWPNDGGAFVTLPQVYTEDPERPGYRSSNLGMYRVQLSGNAYERDREVGLHYQLHRGIGVHHQAALRRGEPLRVNVFVGGPPAMTVAAVMPLPEGLPELSFAGALNARAVRMVRFGNTAVHADADFVIRGVVHPGAQKPEGPFGDHLGYYAKQHDFPFLRVEAVHHRAGAIWPFTTVGRPPQEDTTFGELIHELTAPLVPNVLPGVRAVHAVDAAGVHPLLLAIGSERYTPYATVRRPMELLTQANAILGNGQMSLAKYLLVTDDASLDIHDVGAFFRHVLERVDLARDLHFQTNTTIDTLDYSGDALNQGSKLVIAAVGDRRRELPTSVSDLRLPDGFSDPRVVMPGVLAVRSPRFSSPAEAEAFAASYRASDPIARFPLVVLVDDAELTARTLSNFLWITFTRSNPAVDVHGIEAAYAHKSWGCRGSLIVDARIKPHHAPPLDMDPEVLRRVDALAAKGGPLHGLY
jgi:4-hydroxy-3-polyprenylbenzoate decarboxylase